MAKLKYQSLLDSGFVLSDDKPKPDWNATSGQEAEILNKPNLSIYSQGANLGNILFVSANAPVANDGNTRVQALGRIDKPFKSIQNAVNIAENGDNIIIFGGTYSENVSCIININLNFYGIGQVTINQITGFYNTTYNFENLNITKLQTIIGPGENFIFVNVFKCNIQICALFCTGIYDFQNCVLGSDGSIAQGRWGHGTFKYKNCVFTNNLFYFYNDGYGINFSNRLIFENCEFKTVELTGGNLTPSLISFDKCKFITPTSYNLVTSNIILTNLLLINCISNKPINPSIIHFNSFYHNLIIE